MGKPKILIVEDEPPILSALMKVFGREGFEVRGAVDGGEGFEAALQWRPDLIILDIIMPGMDGITMLRRIRETGGTWGGSVKAIVYTNLSYNEKREEARILGIKDFVVKANVRLDEIVQIVKDELSVQ